MAANALAYIVGGSLFIGGLGVGAAGVLAGKGSALKTAVAFFLLSVLAVGVGYVVDGILYGLFVVVLTMAAIGVVQYYEWTG